MSDTCVAGSLPDCVSQAGIPAITTKVKGVQKWMPFLVWRFNHTNVAVENLKMLKSPLDSLDLS
jgi:hypothetical protein